jgi:hypothetical protein
VTIRQERHYDSDMLGSTMFAMRNAIVPMNVNVAGLGTGDSLEDTLAIFTIPANTIGPQFLPAGADTRQGRIQGIEIEAFGTYGLTFTQKTVTLKVGSEFMTTGQLVVNGGGWGLELTLVRTGVNTQILTGNGLAGVTVVPQYIRATTFAENAPLVVSLTAESDGGFANDVVCSLFMVTEIEQ